MRLSHYEQHLLRVEAQLSWNKSIGVEQSADIIPLPLFVGCLTAHTKLRW
jgi:hypothetical protein